MRSATQRTQLGSIISNEDSALTSVLGGRGLLAGENGRILIVDDESSIRDLLSQFLSSEGFDCRSADSGKTALDAIGEDRFDLVISDIRMPNFTGLQLLAELHQGYPEIPVIMITAVADLETAVDAMKQGASDYITKPFDLKKVVSSVKNSLETRIKQLQETQIRSRLEKLIETKTYALDSALRSLDSERDMTLEALVRALDARESETRCHSLRVQSYSIRLARELDVQGQALEEIARGALLHDIGKIGISDAILLKPGKLTEEEWVEMRKHPIYGYEILRGIDFLDGASDLVLRHHERLDGSGYPEGQKGLDIAFGARLFGIVDSYDAMTSDRPYRKALSSDHARSEISHLSNILYDPRMVDAFLGIPQSELDEISLCCTQMMAIDSEE